VGEHTATIQVLVLRMEIFLGPNGLETRRRPSGRGSTMGGVMGLREGVCVATCCIAVCG